MNLPHDQIENVVLVVCDSLSAKRMSLFGHDRDTTPRLEHFFRTHGEVYTNVRSTASWAFLSLPSLLRSALPSDISVQELYDNSDSFTRQLDVHGVENHAYIVGGDHRAINQNIALAFPQNNVHLLSSSQHETIASEVYDELKKQLSLPTHKRRFFFAHDVALHEPYNAPKAYRHLYGADTVPEDSVVDMALIESYQQQPFDQNLSHFARRCYDQEVRCFDDRFMNFVETLDASTLDKTVIMLTADYGESFGQRDNTYTHGWHLFDEVLQVPLCIYDPRTKSGVNQSPHSLLDVAPTILNRFGCDIPTSYQGVAVDLDSQPKPERMIVAEGGHNQHFSSYDEITTLVDQHAERSIIGSPAQKVLVQGRFKYHVYVRGIAIHEFLFEIATDVNEENNLLDVEDMGSAARAFHVYARDILNVSAMVPELLTD